jgi:SAM-dependent methyltransferase
VSRIYDLLARVYDTPDHVEVTAGFHAALRPIAAVRPRGTWVLDVACGTGVLAEKLGRARIPVIGIDSSREMLAIAKRRCRGLADRIRFRRADLASFRVREPCAVASACGDVFNHWFGYDHYWNGHDYFMEGEGGDLAMCCEWDPERRLATVRMVGYARRGRRRCERFETTLVERYHSDGELRSALAAAGYQRVHREPWSPWSDQHLEPAIDRNLWTAYAPGKAE